MPNHITNEIIFRDTDTDAQDRLIAILCDNDGNVDFDILVPAPLNMWWGSVGTVHTKAFGRTHLDWARENWGTKWNAYQHRPVQRTDDTLVLVFDTAWRPPYPWLAAVFNKFKVSFEHNWLDEGAEWSLSGLFDFSKMDDFVGQPWLEARASDAVQKRLHTLHWGVESFDESSDELPEEGI